MPCIAQRFKEVFWGRPELKVKTTTGKLENDSLKKYNQENACKKDNVLLTEMVETPVDYNSPKQQDEYSQDSDTEVIEDDQIRLDRDNNSFTASLLDGHKIMVLVDSGSTSSILSRDLIDKHPCIRAKGKWSRLLDPARLNIANGGHIIADHEIKFDVYVEGKPIVINALVVRQSLGTPDILLGTNDLKEMGGVLNFNNHMLTFRRRIRPCFKLGKDVNIPKGEVRYVNIHGKVKKPFKNKDVVIQATGLGKRSLPNRSFVHLTGNRCLVPMTNTSGRDLKIKKGTIVANLDYRTRFYVMHPIHRLDIHSEHCFMWKIRFHRNFRKICHLNR